MLKGTMLHANSMHIVPFSVTKSNELMDDNGRELLTIKKDYIEFLKPVLSLVTNHTNNSCFFLFVPERERRKKTRLKKRGLGGRAR